MSRQHSCAARRNEPVYWRWVSDDSALGSTAPTKAKIACQYHNQTNRASAGVPLRYSVFCQLLETVTATWYQMFGEKTTAERTKLSEAISINHRMRLRSETSKQGQVQRVATVEVERQATVLLGKREPTCGWLRPAVPKHNLQSYRNASDTDKQTRWAAESIVHFRLQHRGSQNQV